MELPVYDYSRSFLQFTTDSANNHTPRMRLEASCLVSSAAGQVEYHLSSDCMSERMYRPQGLVYEPASLFWLVAGSDGGFLMQKRHADASVDVVEEHRVGERMGTHDGAGAKMLKIALNPRRAEGVRTLRSYAEVRAAILGDVPLNGRTTFRTADGAAEVQLGYPIKTCNIPHGREAWQIDTGPILVPDPAAGGRIGLGSMRSAFILFNAWDWAELALLRPTPVGPVGRTEHFSGVFRLAPARHELIALG